MITALIITLFLIQLITIFVIILLNSKLSKFKELENRQNQLVEEMDNAISVYLIEMKEENNRLITELQQTKRQEELTSVMQEPQFEENKVMVTEIPMTPQLATLNELSVEEPLEFESRTYIPVKKATNAYSKQKAHANQEGEMAQVQELLFQKAEPPVEKVVTYEQQVVDYYQSGKSVEEIAKLMQRGKTEIELLIKFRA